jgi:hypothetical protein
MVFWNMTSCSLVDRYQCFQEPAASIFRAELSAALGSTETLVPTYQTTCSHIPEYHDFNTPLMISNPHVRKAYSLVKL